jgi:hypothetical protein
MKWNVNRELSKGLRIAAIAIVVTGSVAAPAAYAASAAYATPPNAPIVAPPTDVPEMARQTGEAKLLHEMPDARTLPYIEHDQRARPDVKMRDKARDQQNVELGIAGAG